VSGAAAVLRSVAPNGDAPLVVFDFDHTLYAGDSGRHLIRWLITRSWWRSALAVAAAPLLAPLLAFLPTRREGVSGCLWLGTVGLRHRGDLDALVRRYVASNAKAIRLRLLPIALETLERHRRAGDNVVIATGAPPELARAILAFVAHEDVPVVGTEVGRRLGGLIALRHCHFTMKLRMLRQAGFSAPVAYAYSDGRADLALLQCAARPVVVNPKRGSTELFRRVLPPGTPILNWGCPGRGGAPAAAAA
jgi:phosphatidylglycerophosphatase C